jgi:hypothetical protein
MKALLEYLPTQLTKGVSATREGLVTNGYYGQIITEMTTEEWEDTYEGEGGWGLIPWPDAAERLRYREGEPWCTSSDGAFTRDIVCREGRITPSGLTGFIFGEPIKDNPLHRFAAILCEDAEGFRVLHACIKEFGDE